MTATPPSAPTTVTLAADRPGRRWRAWAVPVLTAAAWVLAFSPLLHPQASVADVVWAVPFTVFAVVGAVVISHRPENRVGWMLTGIGLFTALSAAELGAMQRLVAEGRRNVVSWLVAFQPFGLLTYGLIVLVLLTFPDGRLPSPRWKALLLGVGAFLVVVAVDQVFTLRPISDGLPVSPLADARLAAVLDPVSSFDLLGVMLLAAGAGLVARYRSAAAAVRMQIKWLGFAAVGLVASVVVGGLADAVAHRSGVRAVLVSVGLTGFAAGIGVAVVRRHLYDIDLIISRGLAYTALAAVATLVFLGVVIGIGSLIGRTAGNSLVLSIVATAVVAVAFHPLRIALQENANRVVYGRRHTPYESLAWFTQSLAAGRQAETVIQQMADALARGVRAQAAGVYVAGQNGSSPVVLSPPGTPVPDTDPEHAVEIHHLDEPLGTLAIWTQPGLVLNTTERRLLADLAAQAGLVLHNARLTSELQQRVAELRASRQRLVATQDAERRRLERDLHDGAQHDLVALRIKLGLAEREATPTNPRLAALLTDLRAETGQALENIRRLSRGLYPPLLESQGLAAALTAHARRVPLPVEVSSPDVRYGRAIENALYFCCVEALQNIVKHADATLARIRLAPGPDHLRVHIDDDGAGFDPTTVSPGFGLQNITDRIEALGGQVRLKSGPSGTRIELTVPCQAPPVPSGAGAVADPGRT